MTYCGTYEQTPPHRSGAIPQAPRVVAGTPLNAQDVTDALHECGITSLIHMLGLQSAVTSEDVLQRELRVSDIVAEHRGGRPNQGPAAVPPSAGAPQPGQDAAALPAFVRAELDRTQQLWQQDSGSTRVTRPTTSLRCAMRIARSPAASKPEWPRFKCRWLQSRSSLR